MLPRESFRVAVDLMFSEAIVKVGNIKGNLLKSIVHAKGFAADEQISN